MKHQEINRVLKDLYISNINLHQDNIKLTEEMVYQYLTKLGLPQSERDKKINNYFPYWIETFENCPNINGLNLPDWNYFLQFVNGNINPSSIKMYISLDSLHIKQGVKMIFSFLAENNIKHESKIGSEIRTDNIVIRLSKVEDVKKLSDYISNNNYIKEGMQKINPFCFESNGIGYAYDGLLSYNSCIAKIISDYINEMYKLNKTDDEINVNTFYQYIESYSQKPEKISDLPDINNNSKKLIDASLIVELIKYSLSSNNLEDYFNFYKYAINKKLKYNNITAEENKEELLKEVIITMMKKYYKGYDINNPEKSGIIQILLFLNGNIKAITNDNNLRERVKNNLTVDDILSLATEAGIAGQSNKDIIINYINTIILNEIIKCLEIKKPNKGITQIQKYLKSGNLRFITKKIGEARTLAKYLSPNKIQELFINLGVHDIYQYSKDYYKNKSIYIQR